MDREKKNQVLKSSEDRKSLIVFRNLFYILIVASLVYVGSGFILNLIIGLPIIAYYIYYTIKILRLKEEKIYINSSGEILYRDKLYNREDFYYNYKENFIGLSFLFIFKENHEFRVLNRSDDSRVLKIDVTLFPVEARAQLQKVFMENKK